MSRKKSRKKKRAVKQPTVKEAFPASWLELILIAGIVLAIFLPRIQRIEFHGDESLWIASSYYLEAFVQGRFDSPVWRESYETLTQPPVGRYVIGLGRSIGGYGPRDLNRPWNFNLSSEENNARGNRPSSNLLWWSRFPMCVLAVLCAVVIFILISRCAGRLAGYLSIILIIFNPYLSATLFRAMGEAPLLAATMLAALAGDEAVKSWRRAEASNQSKRRGRNRPWMWFGIMGLFCGIAGAAKLNGLSNLAAGLALSLLTVFWLTGGVSKSRFFTSILSTSGLLVLVAALTFVVLNPYLYSDPIGHTRHMLEQRLSEMSRQQISVPSARISGPVTSRLFLIGDRIFHQCATMSFPGGWILNLLLFSLGLWFVLRALRVCLRNRAGPDTYLALSLIALTSSAPALMTPLDWDRYYLFPVFFSTAFIALGIFVVMRYASRWAMRWHLLPEDAASKFTLLKSRVFSSKQ